MDYSAVLTFIIDLYGTFSNEEAWGEENFSKEICHYSIQDSVVIIAHIGETWLE